MTLLDDLGPHLGDLASWATEREEDWTLEALAHELYVRELVGTPAELERYKADVRSDLRATDLTTFEREARDRDDIAGAKITLARARSAAAALDALDWETFNLVAAKIEADEDARQARRPRADEAP